MARGGTGHQIWYEPSRIDRATLIQFGHYARQQSGPGLWEITTLARVETDIPDDREKEAAAWRRVEAIIIAATACLREAREAQIQARLAESRQSVIGAI